jgi:hypothetical protein
MYGQTGERNLRDREFARTRNGIEVSGRIEHESPGIAQVSSFCSRKRTNERLPMRKSRFIEDVQRRIRNVKNFDLSVSSSR